MPILPTQILPRGAHGLGVLMGFSGAGALLGAIALALKNRVQGTGIVGDGLGGNVWSGARRIRILAPALALLPAHRVH